MTSAEIDSLWTIDNPVAGFEALSKALESHPTSSDELHTQLARAFGLQGKFAEGWTELGKVSKNPTKIVAVRVQLESGRLKNSSGDKAAAKPFFLSALELSQKGHFDFYAVDAAHMLGIVTSDHESLDWNEKAISMAVKSKDPRAQKWQGSLLNNTGWTYHSMGKFTDALKKFQEAVAFQEKLGGDPTRLRIARWTVARCLRSLERYQEALKILDDLKQYPEAGFVSEELGEDLLAIGKPDEARPYFKRAFELLSKDEYLKTHEAERLDRMRRLSSTED